MFLVIKFAMKRHNTLTVLLAYMILLDKGGNGNMFSCVPGGENSHSYINVSSCSNQTGTPLAVLQQLVQACTSAAPFPVTCSGDNIINISDVQRRAEFASGNHLRENCFPL